MLAIKSTRTLSQTHRKSKVSTGTLSQTYRKSKVSTGTLSQTHGESKVSTGTLSQTYRKSKGLDRDLGSCLFELLKKSKEAQTTMWL